MENTRKSFFGAAVKANGEGIEPTARQVALQGRKQNVPEKQDSDPEIDAEISLNKEKELNGESMAAPDPRVRPLGTRPRNRALSELVTDHSYLTHSSASATSPRAREAGDAPAGSKSLVQPRTQKTTSPAPPAPEARAPFGKNSRHSRTGRRGLVKKGFTFSCCALFVQLIFSSYIMFAGGAGGKGTWGKPGSELQATGAAIDTNDPNYDSDELVHKTQLLLLNILCNLLCVSNINFSARFKITNSKFDNRVCVLYDRPSSRRRLRASRRRSGTKSSRSASATLSSSSSSTPTSASASYA